MKLVGAATAAVLVAQGVHAVSDTYGDCSHLNNCSGHGTCDYDSRTCQCFDGWGSASDVSYLKSPDCSQRSCPAGKAWVDMPVSPNQAHALTECSNAGSCNRATGQCECYPGFTGESCHRTKCPNNCSGHGRCVASRYLGDEANAQPFGPSGTKYGGAKTTETWDEDKVYRCVCDSDWTVGYGSGETQAGTWFGPDCSRKHCPSGNDPYTADIDEEDCFMFDRNRFTWRGPVTDGTGAPLLAAQQSATWVYATTNVASAYKVAWDEDSTDTDADSVIWPHTAAVDGDDLVVVEPGSAGTNVGDKGNKCHIDCSNRGSCDYSSGTCRCFEGYYGSNCGKQDVRARGL